MTKRILLTLRGVRMYALLDSRGNVHLKLPGDYLDVTDKFPAEELSRARRLLEQSSTTDAVPNRMEKP